MFSRSCCRSWAILAPKGCPKCSKTAPEVDFSRNWYHFGVNFQRIFKDFQKIFHTTPRLMSIRFYMFHHIKATSFQLPVPIFSCLARWRLFARSALDIRRPRVAGGRACVNLGPSSSNPDLPTLLNGSRGVPTRAQMPAAVPPFSYLVPFFDSSWPS